ncbi:N-acetyltransferase family protein [Gemmiger sp.]
MHYSKTIYLKDGTACLLKGADAADAEAVCAVFNLTHAQTDNLLTYPDESPLTAEKEREYLAKLAESPNEIEICAVVDGVVAGTAGISAVGGQEKLRHRAEFGIGIDKAYWSRGIGRALTLACIDCAKEAGYAQLELDVVADNAAALGLYKSVGFVEYGRNPRGFRTRSGAWQELVLMRLELA